MSWLPALRRYLLVTAAGNLVWEVVQLPLYTLWRTARPVEIAFAVLHCLGGDMLIALAGLVASLVLFGRTDWPQQGFRRVAAATWLAGLGYTAWSEHFNTVIKGAWSYADAMPRLPWLDIGAAPMGQWAVVPLLALASAGRTR